MASFSDYLENAVLDHIFGDGTLTITAPVYLALCTAVVNDGHTGSTITEATYTGYARKSIAASDMDAAAAGAKTNGAAITFAACTSGTDTITYWAICDAATLGNVLCHGSCTSTVISTTQTPATIAIGGLDVTLD